MYFFVKENLQGGTVIKSSPRVQDAMPGRRTWCYGSGKMTVGMEGFDNDRRLWQK